MQPNTNTLPLPIQIWLAHDTYDHHGASNTLSATNLLHPIQALVLSQRYPQEEGRSSVRASIGTAIHSAIEAACGNVEHLRKVLVQYGYPRHQAAKVVVNPQNVEEGSIVVWLEQRTAKQAGGYTITGKYDLIMDGVLHDFKSTSTSTYVYGDRDKEHALQGSIYRWLNPSKIHADYIRICYIFLDWKPSQANNPQYPAEAAIYKDIPLLSLQETERWIKTRLGALEQAKEKPDSQLPRCNDEELWLAPPVFKYYTNPEKRERSTKNFTSLVEARTFMASKGGKGIVITSQSSPKRCGYCPAMEKCHQAKEYFNNGNT